MTEKSLRDYSREELYLALRNAEDSGSNDVAHEIRQEYRQRDRQRERQKLGDDADRVKLEEFVEWVERREKLKTLGLDPPIGEDVLEYVALGVANSLDGKSPWPKKRGNKNKRDLMWECYWLTNFYESESEKLPQHKETGGAFSVVGEKLHLSPQAIESHVRNARKLIESDEGKRDFELWLSDYKYEGGRVVLSEQKR